MTSVPPELLRRIVALERANERLQAQSGSNLGYQKEISTPSTPAAGYMYGYADSTQSWGYFINDAGKIVPVGIATLNLPIQAAWPLSATLSSILTYHRTLNFADAADQIAMWNFKLPLGWGGRSMVPRLLWAPNSTNTGNCLWFSFFLKQVASVTMDATWIASGSALSAGPGVTNRAAAVTLPAMSLSTISDGDGITFGIFRNGVGATDTFTGVGLLVSVELSVVG